MKKVIIGAALVIGLIFAISYGMKMSDESATGTIVKGEVMHDDGPSLMEPMPMPEMMPMPMPEPMEEMEDEMDMEMDMEMDTNMFMPLSFDGNLKSFMKANGGKKVKTPANWVKMYGAKKYSVRIDGDVYFKGKKGLYVFNSGKVTKL